MEKNNQDSNLEDIKIDISCNVLRVKERKRRMGGEGCKRILYILELESQDHGAPEGAEGSWETIFPPLDFVDGKPKSAEG